MIFLAEFFDNVEFYLDALELNEGEQTDVKQKAHVDGTQAGMNKALKLWHKRETSKATYATLISIVRSLKKEEVAEKIEQYSFDHV